MSDLTTYGDNSDVRRPRNSAIPKDSAIRYLKAVHISRHSTLYQLQLRNLSVDDDHNMATSFSVQISTQSLFHNSIYLHTWLPGFGIIRSGRTQAVPTLRTHFICISRVIFMTRNSLMKLTDLESVMKFKPTQYSSFASWLGDIRVQLWNGFAALEQRELAVINARRSKKSMAGLRRVGKGPPAQEAQIPPFNEETLNGHFSDDTLFFL
ncbi:hypothetical protein BT96DRAFT_984152 [Gymnopus androsaceus JB14]|uniref:Uncharacterized protein n=1 Tax=Gymnopus androsaceus JB14 TaxID=1447944 RepID=A0A6A4IR82_9AGAR|nr:hypothetical protein BT96DRAFT_984152 [Gymnopus androsaceus JB14]